MKITFTLFLPDLQSEDMLEMETSGYIANSCLHHRSKAALPCTLPPPIFTSQVMMLFNKFSSTSSIFSKHSSTSSMFSKLSSAFSIFKLHSVTFSLSLSCSNVKIMFLSIQTPSLNKFLLFLAEIFGLSRIFDLKKLNIFHGGII